MSNCFWFITIVGCPYNFRVQSNTYSHSIFASVPRFGLYQKTLRKACYTNFEKYISCLSIGKHRVALSRFMCSAHKLMIEEGRCRNIERNNRLCQYCQMNVIEDTFHFLLAMVCPAYRHIRILVLPKYYCRWPTKQKF